MQKIRGRRPLSAPNYIRNAREETKKMPERGIHHTTFWHGRLDFCLISVILPAAWAWHHSVCRRRQTLALLCGEPQEPTCH